MYHKAQGLHSLEAITNLNGRTQHNMEHIINSVNWEVKVY
jgi:hypothetical protein